MKKKKGFASKADTDYRIKVTKLKRTFVMTGDILVN